jgi:hypothetical protein
MDCLLATIGFELTPWRVEKVSGQATPSANRACAWRGSVGARRMCAIPIRKSNKEKILADRAKLTPEQLKEVGLKIEQDENFYIRPKSDVAEQSVREAA